MRPSTLLLALPALAAAQQQVPILDQVKGWFAKATESISSAVAAASESISIVDPVAAGAAKIAQAKVEPLTLDNFKELIQPGASTTASGIETWMVFVTGGNKTCFGLCERSEKAWNESVSLIAASPNPPRLAQLNCETEGVLCHAWFVGAPQLLHIQLPQPLPDQSTPASTFRTFNFNRTTVTASEIAAIHLQDKYLETEPYQGFWHPIDGPLAKLGLEVPVGYAIWGVSQVPSWAFMVAVSFASRAFMARRMPQDGRQAAGQPAAAR